MRSCHMLEYLPGKAEEFHEKCVGIVIFDQDLKLWHIKSQAGALIICNMLHFMEPGDYQDAPLSKILHLF